MIKMSVEVSEASLKASKKIQKCSSVLFKNAFLEDKSSFYKQFVVLVKRSECTDSSISTKCKENSLFPQFVSFTTSSFSRTASSYHFESTKLPPRSNTFPLSSYVGNKTLI